MFDPLFDVVTAILAWFYSLVPSYGMAIALLTLTAVVAVTPLTLKMTRNMLQMQQHMPELKKLQNQHKGDRQAMNEITMAYYKEHGINPVGCLLPMLVQGPIFLVMYRVVDGLTRRTTEIGTQLGFTSRRYADSVSGGVPTYAETPIARGDLPFDPDFLSRDSDLYEHLSADVEMVSLGVDLSRSTSTVISESIVAALPYLLMLLIVLVTSLYQQRQIQGRQSGAAVNPQQQMMMKLIPYMLPVFSYVMPAAVVTYFIVSNLVRIAQQAYITRSFYRGEDSLGAQVAKQRAEAATATDDAPEAKPRSPRSITERKGAPTPKRDAKPARAKAPARKRTQGDAKAPARKRTQGDADAPARKRTQGDADAPSRKRTQGDAEAPARKRTTAEARPATRGGRTGKAPSRGRSGNRPSSGRVTPPGSGPKRPSQNRSRSKKKRR
ncbi:MAG: membrane protein insertase YidC [Acidimicrobiaceae bacterium]|nr:membrane protein insertase YidC [Acidimicrobiaceae bacterium]